MFAQDQGRLQGVLTYCCDEEVAGRVAYVLPEHPIERIFDEQALFAAIRVYPFALVVTGRDVSGAHASRLLHRIRSVHPETPVILMPGQSTREDVIAAMRGSAFCYFSKAYFEVVFDEVLRHSVSGEEWADSIRVESATPAWLRVIARCEIATGDRLTQFMNEVSDLEGKERESVGFALKEILMNAMEYGGQFNRDRLVEVSYVRGKRMMLYRVRDPGEGFSLEELSHAAISNPPEEPVRHLEIRDAMGLRPGGFGVLLSRKLVDDLIYSEQGNDVLLIKYLD